MKAKLIIMTIALAVAGLLAGCENKPEDPCGNLERDESLAGSISHIYVMDIMLYKNETLLFEEVIVPYPLSENTIEFQKISDTEVSVGLYILDHVSLWHLGKMELSGEPYDMVFDSEVKGDVHFPDGSIFNDIAIFFEGWMKTPRLLDNSTRCTPPPPPSFIGDFTISFDVGEDKYSAHITRLEPW